VAHLDADQGGQLGAQRLVPLAGVGQEALVVDVDGAAGDGGGGHGALLQRWDWVQKVGIWWPPPGSGGAFGVTAVLRSLPAIDMAEAIGILRPGSSTFQ